MRVGSADACAALKNLFSLVVVVVSFGSCADATCPAGTDELNGHCVSRDASAQLADKNATSGSSGTSAGAQSGSVPSGGSTVVGGGGAQVPGTMTAPSAGASGVETARGGAAGGGGSSSAGNASSGFANTRGGAAGAVLTTAGMSTPAPGGSVAGGMSVPSSSGNAGGDAATAGTMAPCMPTPEDCDNRDSDCDGAVDEGLQRECGPKEVGICRQGVETCLQGNWGTCVGQVVAQLETCDGMDNNCDGTIDECPGSQRCYDGVCRAGCTDQQCESMGSTCRPTLCNETTGQCESTTPAPVGTACSDGSVRVGFCSNGTCQPDSEVLCNVGGTSASQWLFMTDTYNTCEPGSCGGSGAEFFGPCETKESHQRVVWTLFNNDGASPINSVENVYVNGRDTVCTSAGACRMWFAAPVVQDRNVPVQCTIFDDAGGMGAVTGTQWVPSRDGEGHPSGGNPDASLCTPDACRKWIGRCRVQQ